MIRNVRRRALLAAGASSLLACATSTPAEKTPPPAPAAAKVEAPAPAPAPKPTYGTFGFDLAGMDRSVAPGDDFYDYANGTWAKTTQIPPDRATYGMFAKLAEEAAVRTRGLIEGAAKADAPEGSEQRKLGDYFASFMDEAGIEQKGIAPVKPELDQIAALKDRRALATLLGTQLRADVDALNTGDVTTDRLFGLWVTQDLNDPSHYAPYLFQGGLGLPDRDYYLVDNPRFADIRAKYQQHLASMLKLAGIADAEQKAKGIFELEKQIAQAHWNQVDTQDVTKTNNPWAKADFAKKAPGLDWTAFFAAAGLEKQATFGVWQPSAVTGIAKLVGSQPLQTWKDYLTLRALSRASPYLPKAYVDEVFAFYGKTLSGAPQQPERWKRAVDSTSNAIGFALGKLYVEKYFPPEAKAEAETMVKNILAALGKRIDALEWMSPQTKARAQQKLASFVVGIGYPDQWRDYSGLEIVRGDALGNAQRASKFEYQRNLAKLSQPVDRHEWFMVPHLVNALNSPQQNSIIFPAAILQPPFFDPKADPAVNYGGIGTVIGHEISHSFDDVGAMFDAQGKLANWWTPADLAKFKEAGAALAAQYSAYKPLPDVAVNGELTLGENIADVAGLATAHDAYLASLGGKPAATIDGFTPEQRFFLGFAQVWRNLYREPALRRLLLTDGHAPGPQRAATVRNVDAWYDAFGVKPGQALYLPPEQRVRVW